MNLSLFYYDFLQDDYDREKNNIKTMLISKLNNYTGRKSQSQYLFSLLQKYDISSIFSKKSSEAIENQYSVDNLPEIIPKKYNDLDEF